MFGKRFKDKEGEDDYFKKLEVKLDKDRKQDKHLDGEIRKMQIEKPLIS